MKIDSVAGAVLNVPFQRVAAELCNFGAGWLAVRWRLVGWLGGDPLPGTRLERASGHLAYGLPSWRLKLNGPTSMWTNAY